MTAAAANSHRNPRPPRREGGPAESPGVVDSSGYPGTDPGIDKKRWTDPPLSGTRRAQASLEPTGTDPGTAKKGATDLPLPGKRRSKAALELEGTTPGDDKKE